jgi:hypothetical protein
MMTFDAEWERYQRSVLSNLNLSERDLFMIRRAFFGGMHVAVLWHEMLHNLQTEELAKIRASLSKEMESFKPKGTS